MSIERAQLNFLIPDEFSKKLNNFDIELINFGEFKERSSRTIQNDVLNNFKFTIIKSGECCVYNDQQKIYMKPMDVALISPFAFYSAEGVGDEPLEFYFIRFDIPDTLKRYDFMTFFHLSAFNIYRDLINEQFINECEKAIKKIKLHSPGYFFHLDILLRSILFSIVQSNTYSDTKVSLSFKNSNEESTIIKCIMYIDEHIHENIKVDDLCNYLNVSQSYLYRCFKNVLQTSTKEFLNKYRMRFICSDLQYSSLSIKEIADKYSFPSAYAFTNSFKAVYEISPSEFRAIKKHESISSLKQ